MSTLDQVLAEKIGSWYIGEWPIGNLVLCLIAIVLSVILCGAIGFEREKRGRTAGLRTHLLVGLGSCIIMIISIYGFPTHIKDQTYNHDVARLAAQVITGVGFLGAGAIIHRNEGIKGLTTAATIWIVMAIGLACGSMNFILATTGTIVILVCLIAFKKIERRISSNYPVVVLHAELGKPTISKILEIAKSCECYVKDMKSELNESDTLTITFVAVSTSDTFSKIDFVSKIEKVDGVLDVDILNDH